MKEYKNVFVIINIYLIIFALLILSVQLFAASIGSDTAVTRFNTQQTLDNGDRIAGFAGLDNGFELFNSTVTGLFDSFFSVSGNIQLNGGVLNLNQDLIFYDTADFISLGSINANNHVVQLSPSMAIIPSGSTSDCDISFLTETGNLGPNVVTIDWSYDDKFIAVGMNSGGGDDLRIFFFDGFTLTEVASETLLNDAVNSVSWHPSKYCLALARDSTGIGSELMIFEFNGIDTLSLIDTDTYLSNADGVQWHPTGNFLAATNDTNAEELFVYPVNSDCSLDKAGAVSFNIAPNRNPDFNSIDWDSSGSYLAVGSRGGAGRLYVFEVGFSPLSITQNAFLEFGRVRGVAWNPVSEFSSLLGTVGDVSPELRLYEHDAGAGTLTLVGSLALGVVGRGIDWGVEGACLAVGTNVNGASGEFITYQFDPRLTPAFIEINNFEIGQATQGVKWSHGGTYVANGSNDNTVKIYSRDEALGSYIFSNIRFFLSGNLDFIDCSITFTGQNQINGFGNTLSLSPSCTLKIGQDAGLLFQDIRILGMREATLQMLDSTSTVSFKDVVMHLDTDYTFTQGRFDVIRGFCIEGKGKSFIYTSDRVSTVVSTGIFELGSEVTFKYEPSIASKTLLKLATNSSTMILNSATLAMTATGMQLDTGHLRIEGKSSIANEGSNAGEAMIWGDGTNNLNVEWEPAAKLEISGQFVNKNIPC